MSVAQSPSTLPVPSQLGLAALLGSAALLGGAYYFQYVEGLAPCDVCYWQRYPHMVVVAAGFIALLSFAWPRFAFVFSLVAITALFVTAGIGVYHVGVEFHLWQGPQACSGRIPPGLNAAELKRFLLSTRMVRCDQPAWSLFGVSMAGWNALLSGGLALLLAARVSRHIRAQS
jgi:disulfide bond formation protein DsbB